MFIDKDSIEVSINNGVSYLSLGQYILEAQYQYSKLWSENTGRSLNGTFSGTLNGVYPKITIQFRKLTKSELEIIAPIIDNAKQKLKYYDPVKQQKITIDTYTGDWQIINKNIIGTKHKNEGFSVSFIATKKRS